VMDEIADSLRRDGIALIIREILKISDSLRSPRVSIVSIVIGEVPDAVRCQ